MIKLFSSLLLILTILTILIFLYYKNIMVNPHPQIDAIFFDMDGVLVDTEGLKFQAWNDELKKINIDFQLNEYIPLVGLSSTEILSNILTTHELTLTEQQKKLLILSKNELYKKKQRLGVTPIAPTVKFLKFLLKQKLPSIKIGIVSSDGHNEILTNLRSIGVNPEEFDWISSGRDDLGHIKDPTGTNKPKPYIYQEIAKKLKVNPNNCVVFEDTSAGVTAAHDAGMNVYALPNRFTQGHDFSKSVKVLSYSDLNESYNMFYN